MKKKLYLLFLLLAVSALCIKAANYNYWLVLKDASFVYTDYKGTKYVYPNKSYYFEIKTNSGIQGSGVGKFTISNTNGTASKTTEIYENEQFSVLWNDIVGNGTVKIDDKRPHFDDDTLKAGTPVQFSYTIASLKGQSPVMVVQGNPNPPMGSKPVITAVILTEAVYPNIYETGATFKKAEKYEWTLPEGWKAAGQNGNKFILGANQKTITITPDYFTTGQIKVRAMNALESAGSEYVSYSMNRGFAFTSHPSSITFGDNTTRTFTVSHIAGVTYEWNVPDGWKINGGSSTAEGYQMNSVSVTPSFCSVTTGKVRVRLKKDTEVSPWFDCPYQGVLEPTLSVSPTTVYQYEETTVSLSSINMADIKSLAFLGNGVYYNGSQGANHKISFLQTGTITLDISILMNGCSTPITYQKTITVKPHRISLSGPSTICTTGTYSINNLPTGATVTWSVGGGLSIISGQGTATVIIRNLSLSGSSVGYVRALVRISGTNLELTKDIRASNSPGSISAPYDPNIHAFVSVVNAGSSYIFYANDIPETVSSFDIRWEVIPPVGFSMLYGGYSPLIDFNSGGGSYTLRMRWSGSCGNSPYAVKNISVSGPPITDPRLRIYPNPATDILTIELATDKTESGIATLSQTSNTTAEVYTIQLWHERLGLVRSVETTESVQQISLQGLPAGTYFVLLIIDGETVGRETILKR